MLSSQNDQSDQNDPESGKVKAGILMWALGVPIPFILLFLLLRGCF